MALHKRIITLTTPFIGKSMRLDNEDISRPKVVNTQIQNIIHSKQPYLISRHGSTELHTVVPFLKNQTKSIGFQIAHALGITPDFLPCRITDIELEELHKSSGVFPATESEMHSFCRQYLRAIPEIDLLGSWLRAEKYVEHSSRCEKVHLTHLNPLLHPESSWTRALKDKRILIIHPFKASIQHQLENKDRVFTDSTLIPDADYDFIVPPQAYGGSVTYGNSWSENLETMKSTIAQKNFDVAILGCGAYGLPLGAHIKKMGKIAIHIGGDVQLLFGIMGTRWEGKSWLDKVYTDHWIRPLPEDRPAKFDKGERGQTPYW